MRRIAILVVSLAALAAPSAAMAQSSTCQAYNPQLCSVSGTSTGSGQSGTPSGTTSGTSATTSPSGTTGATGTTAGDTSGSLPFTGLDVALLAAGGGMLLGVGLIVRRLSSSLS
jgi:hypothetical protein